jgi:hypothetical protein
MLRRNVVPSGLVLAFTLIVCHSASAQTGAPSAGATTSGVATQFAIHLSKTASKMEVFAGRELQKYVYLRTGARLDIEQRDTAPERSGFVIGHKYQPLVLATLGEHEQKATVAGLAAEQYVIATFDATPKRVVLIAGGDVTGALYGVYRMAEHYGVRFYMDGDIVPDGQVPMALPVVQERHAPLFAYRGIQPFHDFPEGPDWWNVDDYKAIIGQLVKMRMNFIGLHTYPEGHPNAEPTVWIGPPSEVGKGLAVKSGYSSSYANTARSGWGYAPKKTSDYAYGAAGMFDRDDYGPDTMRGMCPTPSEPRLQNELFERVGAMLADAFSYARAMGVMTCVGTETPLIIPAAVQERLKAAGKNPADPAVVREVYEGIFKRIKQTCPVDFYWLWTPESWLGGMPDDKVKAAMDDMKIADEAARRTEVHFRMATCGWVLGPQNDRAAWDRELPKNWVLSCINRSVGMAPVESGFADVKRQDKWAIPWLEDDPALTSMQLWAGRMRRDAFDAKRYGCNGLMGIHWRTRVLGPAVSALAQAAWSQDGWADREPSGTGPVGGQTVDYPHNKIEGTEDAPLYQTVRFDVDGYRLAVPNGSYTVTLQFCEPHYGQAGKRVFGVTLQGKPVINDLDIFAKVGQNHALDYTFNDVQVTDGRLLIGFTRRVEYPCIAAIAVVGKEASVKINCGGPAYKDYIADPPSPPRDLPVKDFYADWATQQFGAERQVGSRAGEIFARIDGHLPRPTNWIGGPGGIQPDARPWAEVLKEYAFVDEFAALATDVNGAANRDRYAYWLNTFQYMRAIAQATCEWGRYEAAMKKVRAEQDAAARKALAAESALPIRKSVVKLVGEVYVHLLATVGNPGEMGTVMNWEQHCLPEILEKPGKELAGILGEPLPGDAMPPKQYAGPARIFLPTVRTSLTSGEELNLRVIVLGSENARGVLRWRPLGQGEYRELPLQHIARDVYTVRVPAEASESAAMEYYVQVSGPSGETLRFPATAPERNQVVTVIPR